MRAMPISMAMILTMTGTAAFADDPGRGRKATDPERVEKIKQKMAERTQQHRLRKVLQMSETLGLNEAETIRLNEALSRYDQRYQELLKQRIEARRTVARAARKDPEALKSVDQAIRTLHDARIASLQLEREVFESVARDLAPEKKAMLVLSLGAGGHKGIPGHGGRSFRKHFKGPKLKGSPAHQ